MDALYRGDMKVAPWCGAGGLKHASRSKTNSGTASCLLEVRGLKLHHVGHTSFFADRAPARVRGLKHSREGRDPLVAAVASRIETA